MTVLPGPEILDTFIRRSHGRGAPFSGDETSLFSAAIHRGAKTGGRPRVAVCGDHQSHTDSQSQGWDLLDLDGDTSLEERDLL